MNIKNRSLRIKNHPKLLSIKNEYGYLSNSFLIPALIMLAIYLALGHKPLGDNSILTLDLNAQYVYFYEALREFVYGDASLLYSFSRSLGGEFIGIYAYYVASPLSYIVAIFPKSMMLFALLTIIIIKTGLCGLSFGFYLHKQTKNVTRSNVILFSVMYALSAYVLTYQNNIMWLDGLYLLPILTYSIERLVKQGRYKLYIAILALTMISHYYIGYMLCWYTLFCFFFTYFKEERAEVDMIGEKHHFLRSFIRIGASTILGLGIAAFMIGGAYYSLQFGKNEFTDPSWDIGANFDLFDLFPKLLPGSYDTVMHEGLPLLYCGVLTLFMLPIYVMARKVKSREKVFYCGFLLLYILIMAVNPLDLIMHGFQEPNCLNYRYSFIVIFIMLVMAYKGFCEICEHSPKKIFATGSALIVLILIAQKIEFPNFILNDKEGLKLGFEAGKLPFFWVVLFSIIAIFATGVILCYFIRSENKARMSLILLCAVCIELFANGLVLMCSMSYNVGWASYSSYADYFERLTPIVQSIQSSDKTFFRSEKTTHRCTNDNMALNIKGLSNSTSTLNQKVIDLLGYLGFYADSHWTQYLGSTVVTDSLFGIKYIYSNKENEFNKESLALNEFMDRFYELADEDEYYYAYKNPYALGIAFGTSGSIRDLETSLKYDLNTKEGYNNPFEVQNMLLNCLLGNSESEQTNFFSSIHLNKTINMSGITGTVGGGLEYSASSSNIEEDMAEFNFTVEKDGPLYLYLPTQYERSFTLFVNGEQYVTNTTYSRIISLGYREAGDVMTLSFRLDESKLYFFKETDYIYTLDMDAFSRAYETLAKTNLSTDERSTDDHIYGSMTTYEKNKCIMTTIPYDKGWKVYVDGVLTDTYAVFGDSLMAFDIEEAGEHTIELRYMPDIYVVCGIISAASIVIFIFIIVLDTRRRKKQISIPASPARLEIETTDYAVNALDTDNDVTDKKDDIESKNETEKND